MRRNRQKEKTPDASGHMATAPGVCCYLFVLVCEIEFLAVIVRIRHTFQLGKGLLGQRPHIPVHTRHAIAFRLDKEKGFHWIGKYDISVEDLLSGDGRGQKIRSAKEFLKEILANGSMEQAKIAEEAEERGIKKKTLWNAKKELQIDSVKIGNKWFWMLQDE